MKRWIQLISAAVLFSGAVALAPLTRTAGAVNVDPCDNTNVSSSSLCSSSDNISVESAIKTIIEVLLWLIGILSVVMIIFAGIRYTTSAGSPEAVKNAKNILIYSIVGLVVAIFAYAIVQWVYGRLT